MAFCRNCGSQVTQGVRFCASCGAPLAPPEPPTPPTPASTYVASVTQLAGGASLTGHVVNILASLTLVIGPFLPWMTAVIISVSGVQKTNNEALVLTVLGALGIVASVVSLASGRDRFKWAPFVVGAVALALSLYYYVELKHQLSGFNDKGGDFLTASLGVGIYLCIVASFVVLVAAFVVALRPKKTAREA